MPIYHNPHEHDLVFEIGDERYTLPSGHECEIPRRLEYCVAARGLPLKKGRSGVDGAVEVESEIVEPTEPRLPAGIETGPRRDVDEDDEGEADDEEDVDAETSGDGDAEETSDEESPVADAVAALAAQGVKAPGKSKRGKRK